MHSFDLGTSRTLTVAVLVLVVALFLFIQTVVFPTFFSQVYFDFAETEFHRPEHRKLSQQLRSHCEKWYADEVNCREVVLLHQRVVWGWTTYEQALAQAPVEPYECNTF